MENIKKIIADTFNELANGLETGRLGTAKVAVVGLGSEHGEANVLEGAMLAALTGLEVFYIGTREAFVEYAESRGDKVDGDTWEGITLKETDCEDDAFKIMESLLANGEAQGAVAMHYPFPIGVSTVGRAKAPANGKTMYIATTTGTTSTDRVEAMILNTISGIATAKACGNPNPTVGFLNLDGARQAESAMRQLQKQGYKFTFADSARAGGGPIMRGNDVLMGSPDVMVTDSLTGNVVIKMLAAATSGGKYETTGDGYGPGIGRDYDPLVLIISRASGAPLIANALAYAAELARGNVQDVARAEFEAAKKAGLDKLLDERKAAQKQGPAEEEVKCPEKEVVTYQIAGIEVMDLEYAVQQLWKADIYAESGMGCTGPIIRVSEEKAEKAEAILHEAGYLGDE